MPNLGVHVNKKATAVSIPAVADSGIPFFVGTAPVHTAAKPGKPNYPLLCTSWDEAVEKLGFSYDWKKYTLCEAMYSHFQLFGAQPAIFCNVLDPGDADMRKPAQRKAYDVAEHRVTLPLDAIHEGLKVTSGEGESAVELKEDEDYTLFYDEDKGSCIIELLEDSAAYSAASLTVEVAEVDPGAVISADIVMGIGQADACMTAVGVIPDLLLAPGWSHDTVVAAILATKAAGINGLLGAKCLIDADSSEEGVTEYSQLTAYKNKNNFVDVNQIVCWPQVKLGDYQFHLSTQLAGLMASVDTLNGGCPYESPSNKNLKIDGCCLEDGTEVNLTWEQVNLIAGSWGVVTAINFMGMGWTAKGNYTACYPANTDVKQELLKQQITETEKAGGSATALKRDEERLSESIRSATVRLENQQERLGATARRLDEAGVSTSNLSGESARLSARIEELSKRQEQAAESAQSYKDRAVDAFNAAGEALAAAGIVAGIKEIGAAYVGTVQAAGEFGATMSNAEALSGANASQMAALTAQAKDAVCTGKPALYP